MSDGEVAGLVEGKAVRTAGTARELHKDPDLAARPLIRKGQSPDAIAPRRRNKKRGLVEIHHEPVRARNGTDQAIQPPIRRKPIDAAGRIVKARLSLIRKVKVAI